VTDFIPVGRAGRPHGLDGAFVVERGSEDERRFVVGAKLWIEGEPAEVVLSRRVGGGRRAIKLDRPVPRGAELAIRRDELPEPDPEHYYVFQLVGLDVVEGERSRGRVARVVPGSANDNLELDSGGLVPLVEDAIAAVDLDRGRIELVPGFLDAG
jgi:16S rRNA processing protein RimM